MASAGTGLSLSTLGIPAISSPFRSGFSRNFSMNAHETRYTQFGLPQDMLASPEIVRQFDPTRMSETASAVAQAGKLFLTGEGSSRLFPAKSITRQVHERGWPLQVQTEAGRQAAEYDLSNWAVFALSNSGKTAEVIDLFAALAEAEHPHRYSLTAFEGTRLGELATQAYVLTCGPESAVAATKSVIEQALFYRALVELAVGQATLHSRLAELADQMQEALSLDIDPELTERIAQAPTIYWAGRNDGVTEELTLKTNEITRKQADHAEGTYAVHGVEEVMHPEDVVIWVDPYPNSEAKFETVLREGVGLTVIAIASRQTSFPTIRIPDAGDLSPFVQICAGWNLLVEVGLHLGINLDKPLRARKVGYEHPG
jgi:glutamine---fructose-6-phosphate transaminase (isomerizing)